MRNIPRLRQLSAVIFVLALFVSGRADSQSGTSNKDGTLVVLLTWDDVDKTPAHDVYVEAHGFVVRDYAEKSFVLKMAHPGRYEAAIPPGVYDVFVSEGTSIPRCRRVLVTEGRTGYWTLMLEHDDVYLQR